jgi:hypothetical protein
MNKFLNILLIPFAIIHIRIIQYRYKKITTENYGEQSNSNIAKLQLLQSKEYYYQSQFSAWGKFHPSFSFSQSKLKRHIKFMDWLFPEKDFKQWDIIVWHNPRAVTYYHNKIYNLQKGVSSLYDVEILKQIKEWREK